MRKKNKNKNKPNNYYLEEQQVNFINEENQKLKKSTLLSIGKKSSKKNKYFIIISLIILLFFILYLIIHFVKIKKNKKKNQIENVSENEKENEDNIEKVDNNHQESNNLPLDNEQLNIKKIKNEINAYAKIKNLSYEYSEYLYRRDEPKISIIIHVINDNEKYLKTLYASIFYQPLKDIEIIFINELNNNITNKIIEDYMKLDKRIVLIKNIRNLNNFNAECEGVLKAKGKYILIVSIFDSLVNNILEKSYIVAENDNLDITQFHMINERFEKFDIIDLKLENNIIYQPQIKNIFYYSNAKFLYDKLIKKDIFLKSIEFIGEDYKVKLNEINEKDLIVYGLIIFSQSYGFLNQIGYYYNKYMHEQVIKQKVENNISEIFTSLFTVMDLLYKKSDENKIEKIMIGYKYFYTKIYIYIKYIKYLRFGFDYINEVIDLYLNSNELTNKEKNYLSYFKQQINEVKKKFE